MIICKKTDEWYIEWHQMTTSSTTNDKELYKEWYQVVQRMTTGDTTSDSEW